MSNRPETGNMRFEDDWTGVYIRGDDAWLFAHWIDITAQYITDKKLAGGPLCVSMLKGLSSLLHDCKQELGQKPPPAQTAQLMSPIPQSEAPDDDANKGN